MNNKIIGNRNRPLNQPTPIIDKINIVKIIELERPDLKVNKGNFINGIGLTIKTLIPATSIRAVLGSP